MGKLYPYLFSNDARKQAEFYEEALNGEIVDVKTFSEAPDMPEEIQNRVMHLVLQAAGQHFFMADDVKGETKAGTNLDLVLEFSSEQTARQAFDGLAKGGQVIMPFDKMFWGPMFGRVEDPFGVRWQITTEHP